MDYLRRDSWGSQREAIMVPMIPVLLVFLGLSLGMEGAGRDDMLPRPVLKAWPSSVVGPRDNVTLRCWSAMANMTFRLGKLQDPGYWQERTVVGQEAEFLLVSPGPEAAGTYFCASRASATSGWSEPSPHVQLQVTDLRDEPGALPSKTGSLCHANITPAVPPDLYPKPWLEALPATIVTPGTNVTLRCLAPQHACSACRFTLFQAGHATLQNVSGELAEVFLEEVTPAQGGVYHCRYQSLSWAPDVWSSPSDALDLLVLKELPRPTLEALPGTPLSLRCAGSLGGMNFALYRVGVQDPLLYGRSPWRWADFPLPSPGAPGTYICYYHTPSAPYVLSPRSRPFVVDGDGPLDYTQGNVARLVLAGLVMLGLGVLGACEWRSRSRPRWHQSGFQPQPQPQAWSGCSTGLDLENAV